MPGSGKTQGCVIPSMMTWTGPIAMIDVKGDMYKYWNLLNKHRGKKCKVFSPATFNNGSWKYDPYAPLRNGGENSLDGNARTLALSLLPMMPSIKDPVWIQATQNFLTGAIIYHFSIGCSFAETVAAIALGSISEMIKEIKDDDNLVAKIYMSKLADVQEKVIGNIGMELSNLAALTDSALLNVYGTEGDKNLIDWNEFANTTIPFDVILEFPEANMERFEPLMRLIINQLIKSLEQRPPRTYKKDSEIPPVLVLLDEFPRLGKISEIKHGLATLRSRGVTFALFVQSFADLDEIYGSIAARVITDLCAFKVIFKIGDVATQEYFSKAVGTTESTSRSVSANHDPITGSVTGYGRTINETREPIIYPEEFLTQKDVVLITPYGFCRVNKTLFYEHSKKFLMPQLIRHPDYRMENSISYSYNA